MLNISMYRNAHYGSWGVKIGVGGGGGPSVLIPQRLWWYARAGAFFEDARGRIDCEAVRPRGRRRPLMVMLPFWIRMQSTVTDPPAALALHLYAAWSSCSSSPPTVSGLCSATINGGFFAYRQAGIYLLVALVNANAHRHLCILT